LCFEGSVERGEAGIKYMICASFVEKTGFSAEKKTRKTFTNPANGSKM